MLKSLEIKGRFSDLQAKIKAMVDCNDTVPEEMIAEAEKLHAEYQDQLAAEKAAKNKIHMEDKVMDKKLFNSAFKSLLKGEQSKFMDTVGTYGVIEAVDARGGYLVPSELLDLDQYGEVAAIPCRHIPVWAPKGNMPTIDLSQAKGGSFLVAFDELQSGGLTQTNPVFANVAYSCTEKGAVVPISNRLYEDAQADVVSVVASIFATAKVADTNARILSALGSISNPKTSNIGANKTFADVEAIDALRKAILAKLNGINRAKAKIVVCDTTFGKLAALKDDVGHPYLNRDVVDPTKWMLEGCEIIAIDDAFMTSNTTLTEVAWVGNFERVASFERQGLEVAVDHSAMFNSDAVAVRGKVYIDVKVIEEGAFVKVAPGA